MTATIHYFPEQGGAYKIYPVDETSSFDDLDDALYWFEAPFYRYAATGAGIYPPEMPGWSEERERLHVLWFNKCPYKASFYEGRPKDKSWWERVKAFGKEIFTP